MINYCLKLWLTFKQIMFLGIFVYFSKENETNNGVGNTGI